MLAWRQGEVTLLGKSAFDPTDSEVIVGDRPVTVLSSENLDHRIRGKKNSQMALREGYRLPIRPLYRTSRSLAALLTACGHANSSLRRTRC